MSNINNDKIKTFEEKVNDFFNECKSIILKRNKEYGNSCLNPKQIFSKASPVEIIEQQIDHKLSRIVEGEKKKDTLIDIVNYICLLDMAMNDSIIVFETGQSKPELENDINIEELSEEDIERITEIFG